MIGVKLHHISQAVRTVATLTVLHLTRTSPSLDFTTLAVGLTHRVAGSYHVELESARNMKRTFVNYGKDRNWYDARQGEGHEFLREASEIKNIWVPFGE